MKSGNPVPSVSADDEGISDRESSRQVRDIQEIIAKLEIVTKRLAHPLRSTPQPRRAPGGAPAEPDTTDGGAPGL
jgi:hypothetical protein